jgi:Domain of unknown function (DUF4410)
MLPNLSRVIAFSVIALLAGCATTTPKAQFSKGEAASIRIAPTDLVKVGVDASQNVQILPSEEDRIAQDIEKKIEDKKLKNPQSSEQKRYDVDVHLTRYQKGSKVARFMLAGLGQMHIDGEVDIFEMPEHRLIETFGMSKTFAWGGAYGASTSIMDIEDTFADGVASTLTGQPASSSKATL